jgi:hypothetical protein
LTIEPPRSTVESKDGGYLGNPGPKLLEGLAKELIVDVALDETPVVCGGM